MYQYRQKINKINITKRKGKAKRKNNSQGFFSRVFITKISISVFFFKFHFRQKSIRRINNSKIIHFSSRTEPTRDGEVTKIV